MTDNSSSGEFVRIGGNLLRGGRVEHGNHVRRLVLVEPDAVAVGILHREVAAERILLQRLGDRNPGGANRGIGGIKIGDFEHESRAGAAGGREHIGDGKGGAGNVVFDPPFVTDALALLADFEP